ncbi:MAG: radical SAM protein [Candidatus Sulfotelmatobacter sp.]
MTIVSEVTEFVALEHERKEAADFTHIDWTLGTKCNYRCSYCPADLHNGRFAWQNTEQVLRFASIANSHCQRQHRGLRVQFTGGEATFHPDFVLIVKTLKESGCRVSLLSNGSRSLDYYGQVAEWVDFFVLTFHLEFAEEKAFSSVVDLVARCADVHINIPMPPLSSHRCFEIARRLYESHPTVSVSLKPLLLNFGSQLYPYSESELKLLGKSPFSGRKRRYVDSCRGRMQLVDRSGRSLSFTPAEIVARDMNHWYGWECRAGVELLIVKGSGDIYRANCRQGGVLGNISQPEMVLLPLAPLSCRASCCHCLTDVMITKRRRI